MTFINNSLENSLFFVSTNFTASFLSCNFKLRISLHQHLYTKKFICDSVQCVRKGYYLVSPNHLNSINAWYINSYAIHLFYSWKVDFNFLIYK